MPRKNIIILFLIIQIVDDPTLELKRENKKINIDNEIDD